MFQKYFVGYVAQRTYMHIAGTTTGVKNFLRSRVGGRRGGDRDYDPSHGGCDDEEKSPRV